MSTCSLIAIQKGNKYKAIYCHFDGYLGHHGPILVKHYDTNEKINALLKLGSLSVLGPELGSKHDFNSHTENIEAKNWCLAYHRDKGEKMDKRAYESEVKLIQGATNSIVDFIYLFRDSCWFYQNFSKDEKWRKVKQAKK